MIKIDLIVTESPEQMAFIIEGMRNPKNSWDKSDSICDWTLVENENETGFGPLIALGDNDKKLMKTLVNAGRDHRKFLRQIPLYLRITAPLYWWKEFDTYKVGTVANSCSTMHKIADKKFEIEDFSCEHLNEESYNTLKCIISALNMARDEYLRCKTKKSWWQMIQLLPSSYNQTRNVYLNYEVVNNILSSREWHKLDEWRDLCACFRKLPYSDILFEKKKSDPEDIFTVEGIYNMMNGILSRESCEEIIEKFNNEENKNNE